MADDDLAPMIVPHWTQGAPPTPRLGGPPGSPASYGQGVITQWNPETFENVIRFHGAELRNLPVMAGPDALTFRPGDVVGIQYWAPEGGSGQYWILPRIIVPGSGAAAQAIASLTSDLGRAVAAAVFADRIHIAAEANPTVTSSTNFGDGTVPGPTLADVQIDTGRCRVFLVAGIESSGANESQVGGFMSVQVSGATTVLPSLSTGIEVSQTVNVTGATSWLQGFVVRTTVVHYFDTLNPGLHTFQAKYAAKVGGINAQFNNRLMIVEAF